MTQVRGGCGFSRVLTSPLDDDNEAIEATRVAAELNEEDNMMIGGYSPVITTVVHAEEEEEEGDYNQETLFGTEEEKGDRSAIRK